MDWTLFWTAAGVVATLLITLGGLIIGCFRSLSNDIRQLDSRLTIIETVLVVKEIIPTNLVMKEKHK